MWRWPKDSLEGGQGVESEAVSSAEGAAGARGQGDVGKPSQRSGVVGGGMPGVGT